jgi:hypothetical protein
MTFRQHSESCDSVATNLSMNVLTRLHELRIRHYSLVLAMILMRDTLTFEDWLRSESVTSRFDSSIGATASKTLIAVDCSSVKFDRKS